MKKISAEQQTQLEDVTSRIKAAEEKIAGKVESINMVINDELRVLIDEYNELVGSAVELVDDVVNQMDEYIDNKPDGWIETPGGSDYEDWKSDWEAVDFTPLERISEIDLTADLTLSDALSKLTPEV